MIEIKSFFTDWHEVDEETARKFVKDRLSGMTAGGNQKEIINKNFLRGITCEELLKEKE